MEKKERLGFSGHVRIEKWNPVLGVERHVIYDDHNTVNTEYIQLIADNFHTASTDYTIDDLFADARQLGGSTNLTRISTATSQVGKDGILVVIGGTQYIVDHTGFGLTVNPGGPGAKWEGVIQKTWAGSENLTAMSIGRSIADSADAWGSPDNNMLASITGSPIASLVQYDYLFVSWTLTIT